MFILLLIITSRLTENNNEEEGFSRHHHFQPRQRMGRYGSQQVATGMGRRQGQKGQTMKRSFIVCALGSRYIFFFLNLDMFVCAYTSHVSSLFYWSYHFYQLFHRRLTQLFQVSVSLFIIIILLLMFYYHPLSTVPTHPFTHSPIHPPTLLWSHDDPTLLTFPTDPTTSSTIPAYSLVINRFTLPIAAHSPTLPPIPQYCQHYQCPRIPIPTHQPTTAGIVAARQ